MNKITTTLLIVLILFAGNLLAQQRTTMYVNGRNIYSACGEKVVFRGINEMFIWSSNRTGNTILPQIAKTGANTVRLAWTTTGAVSELDELIGNSISNKMIPIPELHDATGDFSKLQACLDYWKKPEVIAVIKKYEKWVIVNIANEVGGGQETDQQYLDYYKGAITQLRNAGYTVPLLIDAGGWGNNERYIVNSSVALMAHDSQHNLIFSIHTYWTGNNQQTRFDKLITNMKNKNMPFIIGEGPQKVSSPSLCTESFPYLVIINKCQQEEIGWISWSWGAVDNSDCGAPSSAFDITTNGTYGSWVSSFGEEICITATNSIQKTSVRPPSLLNNVCTIAGIEESNFQAAQLAYPNPFNHSFTINYNNAFRYVIANLGGQKLEEGSGECPLEVGNNLPNGMYILEFYTGEYSKKIKLIKTDR